MPSGSRLERSSNLQPVVCHQLRLLVVFFAPVVLPDIVVLGSALDEGGTSGIFIIEGGALCAEGAEDGVPAGELKYRG